MISFRSEWEWGWKTPLLLDPSAFSPDSEILPELLSPKYLDSFPFSEADTLLEQKLHALKSSRVGLRFERIQEVLFHFHPRTLELRASIMIPGRTEIDLLQQIERDLYIHWEIAAKFYFALDPGGSEDPFRWVGASLQDCLGLKIRTIRERQLRALADAPERHFVGIEENARVFAFPKVHGVLFLPREKAPTSLPPGVSPGGLRGIWIPASEFPEFFTECRANGSHLRALGDRKQWIQDQRLISGIAEETQPSKIEKPEQFTILSNDGKTETRLFVVPDDWRERAEGALDSLIQAGKIKV